MKIGVFLSSYPVFSETFVHNELLWLQKSGIEGKIWHELKGENSQHPAIKKISFSTQQTPHKIISKKNLLLIIKAHLYWLFTQPKKYLLFWWTATTLDWWQLRYLIKTPLIAIQVKNFGADLLYVHEADHAYYYALFVAKLCQIPVGIIFHTYFLFSNNKYLLQKIKTADFVVFQSNYSRWYVKKYFFINPKHYQKLHVISSPGIDTNFFKKIKSPKPRSIVVKLITIGRLEESKGYHHLIKAISLLKKRGIKIKCEIIGYGSSKNRLAQLTKSLGLTKEIVFLGKIPHNKKLVRHLSMADIFVLPSIIDSKNDRDMQPNVVKEAMSMGLLVLTSDLGGAREVITHQKNGFLLKTISAETIAQNIIKIGKLSIKEKQLITKSAREKIVNNYEKDKINQQLIRLFTKYVRS